MPRSTSFRNGIKAMLKQKTIGVVIPYAFFDGVSLVVFKVSIQLLQFEEGFFPGGLCPGCVKRWGFYCPLRYRIWNTLYLPVLTQIFHLQTQSKPCMLSFKKCLNALQLPCGFSEFAVDFFVDVNVKGSLDEGQSHLQSFHSHLGAVVCNKLQPLNPHQSTVTGCILLKILYTKTSSLRT